MKLLFFYAMMRNYERLRDVLLSKKYYVFNQDAGGEQVQVPSYVKLRHTIRHAKIIFTLRVAGDRLGIDTSGTWRCRATGLGSQRNDCPDLSERTYYIRRVVSATQMHAASTVRCQT